MVDDPNAQNVWVTVPGYDPFYTTQLGAAIINQDNQRIAELLADPAIDVNAHDGLALREAALGNNANAIDMLVGAGADLARDGGEAVALAVKAGHLDLASRIVEMAAQQGHTLQADIPAPAAAAPHAETINEQNITLSLPSGERVVTTALGAAIIDGDMARIEDLLADPAVDINAHDGLALKEAALGGNAQIVTRLLESGADPTMDNQTAVALAKRAGYSEIAEQIAAAAEGRDYVPSTPVPPPTADINALTESAFVEGYGSVNATPLSKAVIENDMARVTELLQNPDVVVDAHDGLALREAVANGMPDMVVTLLQNGADARQNQSDILKLAAQQFEPNDAVIMALVEAGADPSVVPPDILDNWTPAAQESCAYQMLRQYGSEHQAPAATPDAQREATIPACAVPSMSLPVR